ncbi:DUF423 domain-containing protein [Saccharospirillum mangrovi]|uniref:DUF423 domain-containing protein n=1 Tax=Saccharospirillum mangrovi TaxID=2161747 RepID=UPI000D376603|nr:DUF423 domain-containing protein [Saccharospirillum mangrovi]
MKSNARPILIGGALLAGIGVAFGAFGSHALESWATPDRLDTWQTAVRYQLIHALALLAVGAIQLQTSQLRLMGPAFCLGIGSLIFSGSLYALVLLQQPLLGAVTPLGGLAQIAGWCWLTVQLWRWRPNS